MSRPDPGPGAADLERQVYYLSALVQIEKQLRRAETRRELAFVIVNDSLGLLNFRQAVFWERAAVGGVRISAVSGVDPVDPNAPYPLFLKKIARAAARKVETDIRILSRSDFDEEIGSQWEEWTPGQLMAVPLRGCRGEAIGGLIFMRPQPWGEAQTALAERMADAFSHAWQALGTGGGWRVLPARIKKRPLQVLVAICLAGALFLPVRLSVLAPMEIIPLDPVVVAAPMDGAVASVAVSPNQAVAAGEVLFTLDDIRIRNEHDIAEKALSVALADQLRARQKAFADETSRAELLALEARVQQQQATVDYLAEKLERSRVKAAVAGLAVFTDPNDWLGKPVVVGEKIMTLADPDRVEAEIQLPVADAINLAPGATVRLFLNVAPEKPFAAILHHAAYEAQVTPAGVLAFRLKARLSDGETPPRIGLRGTAKIYGERVSLFYYLLRRPFAAMRQRLGV